MRTRIKVGVLMSLVLVLSGCSMLLSSCNQIGVKGNRVKNNDSYLLEIESMNDRDTHKLELKAGDVLKVEFKTEKGRIKMEIKAPDETLIYSGNGEERNNFTINIQKDGIYTIIVEARNGKGYISVSKVK